MRKILFTILLLLITTGFIFYINRSGPAISDSMTGNPEIRQVELRNIRNSIRETGIIELGKIMVVNAPISTKIKKINIRQGDKINKGQLLFQLDKTEILDLEKEAKLKFEKAKSDFEKLSNPADSDAVQQAELNYLQAGTALQSAQRVMETNEKLYREGYLSKVQYSQSQDELELAKRKYHIAEQSYSRLTTPVSELEFQSTELNLQKAQRELNQIREQLKQFDYRAPFAGTILDVYIRDMEWEIYPDGIPISQGNSILRLGDTRQIYIKLDLFENDIDKIEMGQKTYIYPGPSGSTNENKIVPLTGRVDEIGLMAVAAGHLRKFPVRIKLDKTDERIKPGGSVDVEIVLSQKESVPAIPLRFIRQYNGHILVTRLNGNQKERIEIQTGSDDGQYIEILDGLSLHDRVIIEN